MACGVSTPEPEATDTLAGIRREQRARLIAALISRFGDLDLAEDAVQDAFTAALETWPRTGVPHTPLAWLMTTATRKAIDRLRRERALTERLARLHAEQERRPATSGMGSAAVAGSSADLDEIPDDRLELFFACCHPTLRPEDRVALTLRYLAGLTTVEIAHAFFVPVATMQQRLVRAKKRMRVTRIPVRVPDSEELPGRLPAVLAVVYLVFTEGYAATAGTTHLRADLTTEAVRLARVLHRLMPESSEVAGLLALMLVTEARATSRVDDVGWPVPLGDQDRQEWDRDLLAEGIVLAEKAAAGGPGPYAIQACIAAIHAEAPGVDSTDWAQIVVLYDLLESVSPGPEVRLSRAVAVGRRDGPLRGLVLLDALSGEPELRDHHPYHEARAVTLELLGRRDEARGAWERAHALVRNEPEREYVERRWWSG